MFFSWPLSAHQITFSLFSFYFLLVIPLCLLCALCVSSFSGTDTEYHREPLRATENYPMYRQFLICLSSSRLNRQVLIFNSNCLWQKE